MDPDDLPSLERRVMAAFNNKVLLKEMQANVAQVQVSGWRGQRYFKAP